MAVRETRPALRRGGAHAMVLAALASLVLAASSGCDGGSAEGGRPSLTASRTATLPSATRSVTASPTRTGIRPTSDGSGEPTTPEPSTPEPTSAGPTSADPTTAEPTTPEPSSAEPTTPEPSSDEPTTAQPTTAEPTTAEPTTPEPTSDEPTTAEATTAEATGEPTSAAADEAPAEDAPLWPWVVALLVAAAALVGAVVWLRRQSATRNWATSFDTAVLESQQLARDLAPGLLGGSPERLRGGWQVARAGVVALEGRLATLARSAPDELRSTNASEIGLAVGDVRRSLDDVAVAPEPNETLLVTAHDARRRLDAALAALAAPAGGPPA